MWRTSKAFAYAQLNIPQPLPHQVEVQLSSAELAWASRDVRELGGAVEELPQPPLGPPLQQQQTLLLGNSSAADAAAPAGFEWGYIG